VISSERRRVISNESLNVNLTEWQHITDPPTLHLSIYARHKSYDYRLNCKRFGPLRHIWWWEQEYILKWYGVPCSYFVMVVIHLS